jgi:hypothetical protein
LDNIYDVNSIKVLTDGSDLVDWNIPEANTIYEHEQSGSESDEEEKDVLYSGECSNEEEEKSDGVD